MGDFEIWVYRGLIAFLVTIVLATLKTIFKSYKESQESNEVTFQKLSESIDTLNSMLVEIRITLSASKIGCDERHKGITEKLGVHNSRLNQHESIISEHDKEIAILKEKAHERQNNK